MKSLYHYGYVMSKHYIGCLEETVVDAKSVFAVINVQFDNL